MSILISDCNEIANSNLNTSQSKHLYSIPKSARFKTCTGQNQNICYVMNPTTITTIGAKFGSQERADPFKHLEREQTPPPNAYEIKTSFTPSKWVDINRSIRSSGTFLGAPRISYSKVVSVDKRNFLPHDPLLPGPGWYNDHSQFNEMNHGPKYSLRPKTSKELFKINFNPGPGAYNSISTKDDGKYPLSQIKSINGPLIRQSLNFSRAGMKLVPGPGQYNNSNSIIGSTNYSSKFIENTGQKFTKEKRTVFQSRSFTPGPGNYRVPSDFGHYVSKTVLNKFSSMLVQKKPRFSNQQQQQYELNNGGMGNYKRSKSSTNGKKKRKNGSSNKKQSSSYFNDQNFAKNNQSVQYENDKVDEEEPYQNIAQHEQRNNQ